MILKYETEHERESITKQQELEGYVLIGVKNITEGNFLVFSKNEVTALEELTNYMLDVDYRLMMVEMGLM